MSWENTRSSNSAQGSQSQTHNSRVQSLCPYRTTYCTTVNGVNQVCSASRIREGCRAGDVYTAGINNRSTYGNIGWHTNGRRLASSNPHVKYRCLNDFAHCDMVDNAGELCRYCQDLIYFPKARTLLNLNRDFSRMTLPTNTQQGPQMFSCQWTFTPPEHPSMAL